MTSAKKSKFTPTTTKKGRTYYPSRSFDDDLVALVELYKTNGWAFSGVDLGQLEKDSSAQREERKAHDATEAEWLREQKEFGMATEARHQRFSAALGAARGAFRNDQGITAQLEKFRRSGARRTAKTVNVPLNGNSSD